ncbi:hypothetical protein BLA23254_06918 [Burkholderia lata]|uniref:Uncharacterized protein n=1 Tax=Burkholderia lata (strain ATCC 17760 / DSM 23089 / LMG 22485 / NCIMB 9086 / R18194 / 383) TaxID=482957 RepID=A0A6P2RV87_BURL3|nr:hypothetical protein BLA23254_06918 [Burkholderia lata]
MFAPVFTALHAWAAWLVGLGLLDQVAYAILVGTWAAVVLSLIRRIRRSLRGNTDRR